MRRGIIFHQPNPPKRGWSRRGNLLHHRPANTAHDNQRDARIGGCR